MLKGHLVHLVGYFYAYCQIVELFPCWEKEIPTWYFSKKLWPNKWVGEEEKGEKVECLLKGLNKKGWVQESVLVYLWSPLFKLSTSRKGLPYSSKVEHREYGSSVTKDKERFISNLESDFSELIKREDWEKPL